MVSFASEDTKAPLRLTLRFQDQLFSDPASISIAVRKYFSQSVDFSVEWPDQSNELLELVEKALEEADGYFKKGSRFYGAEPASIKAFHESAWLSRDFAKKARRNAGLRIRPLLEGMREYWGYMSDSYEAALGNYLTLVNFEIQRRLAYSLGHERTRYLFAFRFWQPWLVATDHLTRMAMLFKLEGSLCNARVLRVSSRSVNDYFWGRQADLLKSKFKDDAITNHWFVRHFLPQFEFKLAMEGVTDVIPYSERAYIDKIIGEDGNEI